MNFLKTAAVVGLSATLLLTSTGCSLGTATLGVRIDPGEVGLLVDNYGKERGIENAQLFEGGKVTFNDLTHDLYQYPVYFRTYNFEGEQAINFSIGGSPASMPIGATYRFKYDPVKPEQPNYTWIHQFFRSYRVSPDQFNAGTFRNALRDCATEIGSGGQATALATNVAMFQKPMTDCLQKKFPELDIKEVSILGRLQLPEQLQASIDAAVKANQDAETAAANVKKAEAEAKAKVAEAQGKAQVEFIQAEAESKANQMKAASITPALVQYEEVMNDRIRAEKGLIAPITIQSGSVQVSPGSSNPVQTQD